MLWCSLEALIAAFCGIWSRSLLFAGACLSALYLGYIYGINPWRHDALIHYKGALKKYRGGPLVSMAIVSLYLVNPCPAETGYTLPLQTV